jgi:hypothetical protein
MSNTTEITLKTVLSQAKEAWAAESKQLNSLDLIKYLFEIRLIKLAEGVNMDKKQFHLFIYTNVFGIKGDLKDHPQAKNIALRVRACDYLISVNREQIMSAKPAVATMGADIDRLAARAFKGIKRASDIYKLMTAKKDKQDKPTADSDTTQDQTTAESVTTQDKTTPAVDPVTTIRQLFEALLKEDKNKALDLVAEGLLATYHAFERTGEQKNPKLKKTMHAANRLDPKMRAKKTA